MDALLCSSDCFEKWRNRHPGSCGHSGLSRRAHPYAVAAASKSEVRVHTAQPSVLAVAVEAQRLGHDISSLRIASLRPHADVPCPTERFKHVQQPARPRAADWRWLEWHTCAPD